MEEKTIATHKDRGQSLVEFAFGLVILLILTAGIVDGGRALFTYMALRDAAQEGAVYAALNPTDANEIRQRVKGTSTLVGGLVSDSDIDITLSGTACSGNGVTIKVGIDQFKLTMPFLGTFVGGQSVPISASVSDTILRPACP